MVNPYLCVQSSQFYSQSYIALFEFILYHLHAVTDNAQSYLIIQSKPTITRRDIKQYQQTSIDVIKIIHTEY